jgi:hypothetical protein
MKKLFFTLFLVFGFTGQIQAQNLDAQQVIRDQVNAFERNDFVTAFGFADKVIQQVFKTPQRFGQMVTSGYPMVLRPQKFEFTDQRELDGAILQYVVIEDKDGVFYLAEYKMTQADGIWKIAGVQIKKAPMVGA